MTALAPCPFCGGGAAEVVRATYDDAAEYAHVMCSECEANSACYGSEAEAIAAWNRRAPNDQTEALAQWMHARGIATGHGETVADLLTQLSLDYRRAPALRWRSEPPDVAGWWLAYGSGYVSTLLVTDHAQGFADDLLYCGPIHPPEEGEA